MKKWKSQNTFYKCSLLFISLLICTYSNSQITLERQVIGSTGNHFQGPDGLAVSYTVGEAIVNTFENNPYFLTQGFHQPDGMLLPPVSYLSSSESTLCPDVSSGEISVNSLGGCLAPYAVRLRIRINGLYITADSVPQKFENESVTFDKLPADTFIVEVIGATYCVESDTIIIESKNPEGCGLKVYSGITPNGDGSNDFWIIDNIERLGDNEVSIFNRWGNEIWNAKNYDNEEIVWEGKNKNGNELPDATYFYIIKTELPDQNGSTTRQGWVEITR